MKSNKEKFIEDCKKVGHMWWTISEVWQYKNKALSIQRKGILEMIEKTMKNNSFIVVSSRGTKMLCYPECMEELKKQIEGEEK